MKPQIIVMLTHNDVTVANARDCFRDAADLVSVLEVREYLAAVRPGAAPEERPPSENSP